MMKYLLAFVLLLAAPAWATWTVDASYPAANTGCNGVTCTVTVPSTSAHHLLVAGIISGSTLAIASVDATTCNTTWTHAPNTAVGASGNGWEDLFYCTDSVAGKTSIVITSNGNTTMIGVILSASSSLGTIALDSGANPSNSRTATTCTSCAGVLLTLSANNDIAFGLTGNGQTGTGVTGTGCINDLSNPGGDGVAHCINVSGTATYPATWTQSPTGTMTMAVAAFQETAAGSVSGFFTSGKSILGGKFISK